MTKNLHLPIDKKSYPLEQLFIECNKDLTGKTYQKLVHVKHLNEIVISFPDALTPEDLRKLAEQLELWETTNSDGLRGNT